MKKAGEIEEAGKMKKSFHLSHISKKSVSLHFINFSSEKQMSKYSHFEVKFIPKNLETSFICVKHTIINT